MNGYLVEFTNKAGTCIHGEYCKHHSMSQSHALVAAQVDFIEDTLDHMTDEERKACDVHITPL